MNKFPYPFTISQDMTDAPPNAYALVNGSPTYPDIPSFYGFHIHEHGDCSHSFANTGGHYNPQNQPHPFHAGDLPPVTSCDGYSWMSVYIQQLRLNDVIGRSVVLHGRADDFTTQPSGNSGEKIACGIVEKWVI